MRLNNIGKLMSIITRQSQMYFAREMNKIGITGSEYIFILNVPDYGSTTQQEICNKFELDPAFATRSINSLVKKGYLNKIKSNKDKRSFEIKLTDKGKPVKEQVQLKLDYWSRVLNGDMSDSKIDDLINSLSEIKHRASKELKRYGNRNEKRK